MKKRGILIFMYCCIAVLIADLALMIFKKLDHKEMLVAIGCGLSMASTAAAMILLLRSGLIQSATKAKDQT